MQVKHLVFALAVSVGLVVTTPAVVLAQDASPTPEATSSAAITASSSADIIYIKPRQTAEILKLRELYQDEVEKYTDLERTYLINKAQFQKLNTLQSLEEAIKSTREVMLARDDVLITYFELMRACLDDTPGVELTEKQKNIDEMVGYINALKDHREKVLNTSNREDIAARAKEFDQISPNFESTAYKSLANIRIGDIQTVFDKAEIIYKDVLKYHQDHPTSPLRQQERDRAYKEVNNAIEKSRGDLLQVRNQYTSSKSINRSQYNSGLATSLNTAYSGTSQILSFLEELFSELT